LPPRLSLRHKDQPGKDFGFLEFHTDIVSTAEAAGNHFFSMHKPEASTIDTNNEHETGNSNCGNYELRMSAIGLKIRTMITHSAGDTIGTQQVRLTPRSAADLALR
jgi:hypothetical protein